MVKETSVQIFREVPKILTFTEAIVRRELISQDSQEAASIRYERNTEAMNTTGSRGSVVTSCSHFLFSHKQSSEHMTLIACRKIQTI